jgi:hypothetical protein
MPAELDVVKVWCVAVLVDEYQFVLGAVKAALAGIGLVPDNEVLKAAKDFLARVVHLAEMSPVDTEEVDRAIFGEFCG